MRTIASQGALEVLPSTDYSIYTIADLEGKKTTIENDISSLEKLLKAKKWEKEELLILESIVHGYGIGLFVLQNRGWQEKVLENELSARRQSLLKITQEIVRRSVDRTSTSSAI